MTTTNDTTASSRPMDLSVIAPCYNEEGNIDPLADRMLATFDAMGIAGELVLVDDGSRDATWDRVTTWMQKDSRVRGKRHFINEGMESAWRTGLAAARGQCACLIDADLQNRPEDVAELYDAFAQGEGDVIQAVRHAVAAARHRCLFTRGLNFLLNCVFGMNARDNKSGFILCRREVLADLLRHRCHYRYYQSFIGAAAHVRGYRLAEVDTVFEPRQAGQSFLSRPIRVSLRILWETLKFRWETRQEKTQVRIPKRPVVPFDLSVSPPTEAVK